MHRNEKGQVIAPKTIKFGKEAFEKTNNTIIRWLGNGGAFINSHGACIMIDPLLKGFDMPLLIEIPIDTKDIPHLDGILITHCDNDHFSRPTCRDLSSVCSEYHSTNYVSELLEEENIHAFGHNINEIFNIGDIKIKLTPAYHSWQNEHKKYTRVYKMEDYCGYYLETKDGTIWMVGDSRLLEEHLNMPEPDVIILDFSDDLWHIGLQGAIKLCNTYPNSQLILSHYGSVDAPQMKAFNGDPEYILKSIINPKRANVLAPGQQFELNISTSMFKESVH